MRFVVVALSLAPSLGLVARSSRRPVLKTRAVTDGRRHSSYLAAKPDIEEVVKKAVVLRSTNTAVEEIAEEESALSGLLWRGVVVALCALWASNFAATKLIVSQPGVDSSLYAVARFGVAATALMPPAISKFKELREDTELVKDSLICGSWVAFGYLGQTLGLLTTTASRSCVICSLHCVFVACLVEFARLKKQGGALTEFDPVKLAPALIAVLGVGIVEIRGEAGAPNFGDLLSFAQPIGFGMGYYILEKLMVRRPDLALPVATIKLSVVALASLALFEITGVINNGAVALPDFGPILASPLAMQGIAYTGLVTTALALWVESIAFARVPATDASIILTTEPLFAAGFGAVTLGETFGVADYVGASLIIAACAAAVLLPEEEEEEAAL